jgi:hypothetical protein
MVAGRRGERRPDTALSAACGGGGDRHRRYYGVPHQQFGYTADSLSSETAYAMG